jgi:HSP20 family protein
MANEQSKRQGERQQLGATESEGIERAGAGERGLATRQYQDPFSVFDALFERMQRDFFGTSLLNALVPGRGGESERGGRLARMPRVHMRDTGDVLEVRAEMPGIEGSNVSVTLDDDVLTINGEQRDEEGGDERRSERYISFYRQIPLPDGVDTEQPEASYRDGVLTVRFRKTRARTGSREIPITTQKSSQSQGEQPQTGQPAGQQQTKERAA